MTQKEILTIIIKQRGECHGSIIIKCLHLKPADSPCPLDRIKGKEHDCPYTTKHIRDKDIRNEQRYEAAINKFIELFGIPELVEALL